MSKPCDCFAQLSQCSPECERYRETPQRRDLRLAAQALREAVHFTRLSGPIDMARGAAIARSVGGKLDDFFIALARECGVEEFAARWEPFWDLCNTLANSFEERDREIRSHDDNDQRADWGCWKYHQGADQ